MNISSTIAIIAQIQQAHFNREHLLGTGVLRAVIVAAAVEQESEVVDFPETPPP